MSGGERGGVGLGGWVEGGQLSTDDHVLDLRRALVQLENLGVSAERKARREI